MKHCEIVQDLLPLYIEDLTRQGSREFIRDHLSCCSSCMEEYKRMTTPVLPHPEPNEKWKAALEAQRKAERKQKYRWLSVWILSLLIILCLGGSRLKHYLDTHQVSTRTITPVAPHEILVLCPTVVPTTAELEFLSSAYTLPFLTNTNRVIPEEEFAPYRDRILPTDGRIGYIESGKQVLIIDYFHEGQRITLSYRDEDGDRTFDTLEKYVTPNLFEGEDRSHYIATYSSRTATTHYEMHE